MTTNTTTIMSNYNDNKDDNIMSKLATFTTSGPCEYYKNASIHIPGLTLMHDGGRVLYQPSGASSASGGGVSSSSGDISLLHGSITGIVGTNGSGKSSTAQLLASQTLPNFPTDNFIVEYLAAGDDSDGHIKKNHSNGEDEEGRDENDLFPKEFIQSRLEDRVNCVREEISDLDRQLSISGLDPETMEQLAEELSNLYDVEEQMESKIEKEIDIACGKVGLASPKYTNKPLKELSCGWRYKCRLIASILSHPNLLIVDEPSFLDSSSMDWLIESLKNMAQTDNCIVILISHKEYLLDRACDRIVYINSGNQTITTYPCGYEQFRIRHSIDVANATNKIESSQIHADQAEKSLKKMKSKMQKNKESQKKSYSSLNNGNTGKESKTHLHAGMNQKKYEKSQRNNKTATSKLRRAQQELDETEQQLRANTKREHVPPIVIDGMEAAESTIVNLEDVGYRYHEGDDCVFQYVDACIESNDRILLKGDNGCGKSTLVELIIGSKITEPTEGSIWRTTRNIVYFPQTALRDLLRYHGAKTSTEFLMTMISLSSDDIDSNITGNGSTNTTTSKNRANIPKTETEIRVHLGRFGLENDLAVRRIHTLSAGQRVRLWLASQTLFHPKSSLLILDEVSENVDVETRNSLQQLFESFQGAIVVVSHDPDFCRPLVNTTDGNSAAAARTTTTANSNNSFNKIWTLHRHGLTVTHVSD